jgi:hypothetical protein
MVVLMRMRVFWKASNVMSLERTRLGGMWGMSWAPAAGPGGRPEWDGMGGRMAAVETRWERWNRAQP